MEVWQTSELCWLLGFEQAHMATEQGLRQQCFLKPCKQVQNVVVFTGLLYSLAYLRQSPFTKKVLSRADLKSNSTLAAASAFADSIGMAHVYTLVLSCVPFLRSQLSSFTASECACIAGSCEKCHMVTTSS